MTTARYRQVHLDVTPYYHCTTRCVRRSYLCGQDAQTGQNFEHRRGWIEQRLLSLSKAFCIDVAGYAILSNHYHVVLKVNCASAKSLTDEEVVHRWRQIFNGNVLAKRFSDGEELTAFELITLKNTINHWRSELTNISRFMGQINEKIARWANKEDDCKGRFWESRFDSQAILDVDALLRTMVYVDLNPVRAGIVDAPEQAAHTSVHRRLNDEKHGLIPFKLNALSTEQSQELCLPITQDEYLALLDWTGRRVQQNKRGFIPSDTPPILERLRYSPQQWMRSMRKTNSWHQKALGSVELIQHFCEIIGQRWIWTTHDRVT